MVCPKCGQRHVVVSSVEQRVIERIHHPDVATVAHDDSIEPEPETTSLDSWGDDGGRWTPPDT